MDFLRLMFKNINSRFPPEPIEQNLTSIPNAIFAFQQCAGINRDYMAKRLGLTRAKMIHLETYGKPNQETLTSLQILAEEYGLLTISAYFSNQILLVQAHRRKKFKETTGH